MFPRNVLPASAPSAALPADLRHPPSATARRANGSAPWGKIKLAGLSLAMLAATACTTTGVGTGSSSSGAVNATFTWKAEGPTRGAMTAMLNTGEVYAGSFFQVTRETSVDELGPLWVGWNDRWHWHGWGPWGPNEAWATEYTGKVLANLAGPRGHMRCTFTLVRPSSGMAGGGEGRCQLPEGTIIHADFPPS